MARVTVNPDWPEFVMPAWQGFASDRLGPEVADDARQFCPVRTGALKASIRDDMEGDDLIISASGGGEDDNGYMYVSRRPGKIPSTGATHPNPGQNNGELVTREVHHVEEEGRDYAAYVELGHRVFHPSTHVTGPEVVPAQPFLRPALFKRRSE